MDATPSRVADPPSRGRKLGSRGRALVAVVVAAVVLVSALYFLGFLGGGHVELYVHDAPCNGCTHVWVTFTAVSVHESDIKGSGWTDLNVSGSTFDLQALNGSAAAKLLGLDALGAGHYQQIRVEVSKVVVDLTSGVQLVATVDGPSAAFSGQFTVSTGGTTTLNIDIDLASSLHLTPAGATFTPVIGTVAVSGGE